MDRPERTYRRVYKQPSNSELIHRESNADVILRHRKQDKDPQEM